MENKKTTESPHIEDLINKINKFLSKEKPPDILIIKAHLLCEYYIDQLLLFREKCSHKELEFLTFNKKNQKVFDLNNPAEKEYFDFANKLNRLRNKVGHELDYSLAESDINTLGYIEGKKYILNKYDHETDTDRLRSILNKIVIKIALLLINNVLAEKKR